MIGKAVDLFTTYQFIRRLVLPFNKWKAFELGVIDADGNVLKPRSERTQSEKDAWGYFDVLAANLKKLLGKLPGGKSSIATYSAAFLLLNEAHEIDTDEKLLTAFLDALKLVEDGVVTNVAASGEVAGLTGDPPVFNHGARKTKYLRRRDKNDDSKRVVINTADILPR
ncbi:MAG: hypothetical protein DDT26_00306 [Dehalococcoidia bacterium]|nr:hypothetical protein [Chloroflexota bacterium]